MRSNAFYVAVNGNDRWSGSLPDAKSDGSDGPFATLHRARDAVRELKSAGTLDCPVTIAVRAGIFRLSEPLVLTSQDSGSAKCPVAYRAYGDEEPVISGGSGFRKS